MEVLVALTIFLLAFVMLGRLVIFGGDRAREGQQHFRAADLCQSKLAEVIAGALPLTSQPEVGFEEDPDWHWSLDCEKSNFPGLWNVTVRVSRQQARGARIVCTLSEMVLDPQIHGNVQDTPPSLSAQAADAASSGSSSPSSSRPATSGAATMGGK
jgi:hypothetical protein